MTSRHNVAKRDVATRVYAVRSGVDHATLDARREAIGAERFFASLTESFGLLLDVSAAGVSETTTIELAAVDAGTTLETLLAARGDYVGLSSSVVVDADLRLVWERISDLVDVVEGTRLLSSVLRVGRASVQFSDPPVLRLLSTLRSPSTDWLPADSRLTSLPGWILDKKDKEIRRRIDEIGIERLMVQAARSAAEALHMSGICGSLANGLDLLLELREHRGQHVGVRIVAGGDRMELRIEEAPTESSQVTMSWTSALRFGQYVGRVLGWRDALLEGSCAILGDRKLAAVLYPHLSRDPF